MDLLKIVGAVAPSIATAIGGPLGGMAMKVVAEVLGLPGDSSEKDVAKAMASATPDQLLALKQADQDFAVRMRELDIDLEKLQEQGKLFVHQMDAAELSPGEFSHRVPVIHGDEIGDLEQVLGAILVEWELGRHGRRRRAPHPALRPARTERPEPQDHRGHRRLR